MSARLLLRRSPAAARRPPVVPGGGPACMRPYSATWQPDADEEIQRVTRSAIAHELIKAQSATIEGAVPWFLSTMPATYFRQVPRSQWIDHLRAISAVRGTGTDMNMNLRTKLPDGRKVFTFVRPEGGRGLLRKTLRELPKNWQEGGGGEDDALPMTRAQIFTGTDDTLSVDLFTYGHERRRGAAATDDAAARRPILDYAARIADGEFAGCGLHPPVGRGGGAPVELEEYLDRCSPGYVLNGATEPRRFLRQRYLYERVSGTEGTSLAFEQYEPTSEKDAVPGAYWVDIAIANSIAQVALEQVSRCLYQGDFDVVRAYLDAVEDGPGRRVGLIRCLVRPPEDCADLSDAFEQLERNIKRIKWLDPFATDLALERYPWLGTRRAEIVAALGSLMHPIMTKRDSVTYSKANIFSSITHERCIAHTAAIAELFMDRFDPEAPLSDEALEEKAARLRAEIERGVEDMTASILLNKMIDIIFHTKKTNLFMKNRYAFGIRLDPNIMNADESVDAVDGKELPFGVFFVHGRRFNAFHVRFRDIARGGLRLVTPGSSEQLAMETARHYDECYDLAYAQQLKNKDIPEGGSKAVCLIDTTEMTPIGKNFAMRKCVKAFTDSLLDLIVDTEETRSDIVNPTELSEVLYLGPDEQVQTDDIDWIIDRAGERGYATPPAFMSSKPRSGINHKEFGVTSEGVNVYLEVALKSMGIDPRAGPFSVKITGGPDGDVAGNLIKIMFRDYGDHVHIVGIADHSGCIEDPDGLDRQELMRLVTEGLSIDSFGAGVLGPLGSAYGVDDDAGIRMRNTMHNRLEADAFIPAGGRPSTINMSNWKNFLKDDGTPSSPLIVEGANLFITEGARRKFFENGIIIIKDSSANKCGVITSSYEICAAMLLDEDEFVQNKEKIVAEVLVKLRELARLEAELLFREMKHQPGPSHPETSQRISAAMNSAKDAIISALDTMPGAERDELLPFFRDHLPAHMTEIAGDRILDRVPPAYIKSAVSSCLASRLVYREGTRFITDIPAPALAATALNYVREEKRVAALSAALADSDVAEEERDAILELLRAGGVRTAIGLSK